MNTSQGSTTSNSSLPYRTGPAPPRAGVFVNGTALNHTSVLVSWYPPVIKQLRGSAVSYTLDVEERSVVSRVGTYPGTQTRVTVNNLKANTVYTFYVRAFFYSFFLSKHRFQVVLGKLQLLENYKYPRIQI